MADLNVVERGVLDELGEGTLWSARENAVYWVDILAPALNRLSLADGSIARWVMPGPLGWVAEREGGGFIAGFKSGFAVLTLDPLAITPIGDPEPYLPGSRMNDGKVGPDGHIWCGTMDMAEKADVGALYRFGPDLRWTRMDAGYGVPNGPAFSGDGQWLYHADTARRVIYRFRHETGKPLGSREEFVRFSEEEGYPDGMTVDDEDHLWVAHWGGSAISRFDPQGMLERRIALPAPQVTNIVFAGAAHDRMFVTSAWVGLKDAGPYDGALFEVDAGVAGRPTPLFAG